MRRQTSKGPDSWGMAILVMMASTFVMAFQDAVVKYVSVELPLWQIFVIRSLIVLPALLAFSMLKGRSGRYLPKEIAWVMLRSLLLVFMYVAFYAALPGLELSIVAAAYYTGPLFITLFSALLIGEALGLRRSLAVVGGFIGVLVILRPGTDGFSYLMLIPIAAALFYAVAAIITRGKCAGESPVALSIVLNVAFIVIGGIASTLIGAWHSLGGSDSAYPFLLGPWVPMQAREWAILFVLAAANLTIHLGLAKAYQSGPPPIVATFDYSYLVFAVFWGYVIFAESPDAATFAGMLLIAGAGLMVVLRGRAVKAAQDPSGGDAQGSPPGSGVAN